MITDYATISETIEALDRWQVSVDRRPGLVGWTTQRRVFAGTVVDYKVDWLNGECETIYAADLRIVSTIPVPPPPEPWASSAFAALVPLPSNVVPFPLRRLVPTYATGDCA